MNVDPRAPMDVCWDFFLPQFRRSVLVLADQHRSWSDSQWWQLPESVKNAVVLELERMTERAHARESKS